MSGLLERKYRAALRWYPESWRERNEDAVLGTLLDRAAAERRDSPTAAELLDLTAHGIAARLRTLPVIIPAGVRDRASEIALGAGAVLATTLTVTREIVELRNWQGFFVPTTLGPFASPVVVVYVAWILGFVAAMLGLTRTSRFVIGASIPIALGARIVADELEMWGRPPWTTVAIFLMLGLVVVAGRPAATRRGAGRLAVSSVAVLGLLLVPILQRPGAQSYLERDPFLLSWPVGGWVQFAPVALVALAMVLWLARQRAWAGTALLLAAPVFVYGIFGGQDLTEIAITLVIGTLVAAGITAVIGVLRVFGLRVRLTRR